MRTLADGSAPLLGGPPPLLPLPPPTTAADDAMRAMLRVEGGRPSRTATQRQRRKDAMVAM